jgi:hypothetical protein
VAVLRHVGALALGVLVAVASVAVHRTAVPLGLLLAVVTTFAVAWLVASWTGPRTAWSYSLGWLVAVAIVVAGRPEGDYALAQDLPGYLLLGTGVALVIFTVVVLPLRGRSYP